MLILNSSGFVLVYYGMKRAYKSENKRIIENKSVYDSELITEIILLKEDIRNSVNFEFIEENEFKYFGKMYDIIKTEDLNDKIKFICFCDEKENLLDNAFNLFFDNNVLNGKSKSAHSNIVKLIIDKADLNSPFFIPYTHDKEIVNFISELKLLENYSEIPYPPPKSELS